MKMHRKQWKKSQVETLSGLLKKHSVIGIADLSDTPASLVQKLRKNLSGKAVFRVSKTRIMKKSLEGMQDKGGLEKIISKSCLMIFTELDPFEVFSLIKKNQAKAFAKAGSIAEDDIIVPAGDTGLPPGPALSDLKAAGLAIKIQGPTIHVAFDKVVTKKGEAVTAPVANVLAKLDIKPVKVGLKVNGMFFENVFFSPQTLDIDTEKMFNDFEHAYTGARNLSVNAGIFNNSSMPLLLAKAFRQAKAVALEGNVFSKETMPQILAKAVNAAKALESMIPQTLPVEENAQVKKG